MLLNLGLSIGANMLWPLFLSYACRKEIKAIRTSKNCHFMRTSISFNSSSKKSSSTKLSRIGWNVNSSQIS